MLQRTQFIQNTPKRPHITLERIRLILTDFRTHIIRSSYTGHGRLVGGLEQLGDPEISEFDCVIFGEENVLRLDVSVQDLSAVDIVEGDRDLYEPVPNLVLGEMFIRGLFVLDMRGQISNLAVFHLNVKCVFFDEARDVGDDVGVLEVPEQVCLGVRAEAYLTS